MRTTGVHRWLVAVPLLLVLLAACGTELGPLVTGSGTLVTRRFEHSDFTRVQVDQAFQVTLTRGDAFSVSVSCDDNLVEYLRVELDGDTLRLGMDRSRTYANATLQAEVTMPSLRGLQADGASDVKAQGFSSADDLDLAASGGSRIDLSDVSAGVVTIDVSGAGRLGGGLEAQALEGEASGAGIVSLRGSAVSARLEASGAAQLKLARLTLRDADLELSGGARGAVDVTGTLNVEASGGARLEYWGTPEHTNFLLSGGAVAEPAAP